MKARRSVLLVSILGVFVGVKTSVCQDPARRGVAARREGGLGHEQGVPRNDAHPRAHLHQRPVAMAAGRAEERPAADRRTGAISRSPAAGPESPTTCKKTARRFIPIQVGRTSGSAASPRPGISARSPCRRTGPAAALLSSAEYLNSHAVVYVDGKKAGEMVFPAGEVDLTAACPPGSKHVLSMLVAAVPLRGRRCSRPTTTRTGRTRELRAAARPVRRRVSRRHALGARIADVKVDTSVRKGEITFDTGLQDLAAGRPVRPSGRHHRKGKESCRVHEQAVHGRRVEGRPHHRDRKMEGREALGHPYAAEHVRSGRFAVGGRQEGARRGAARAFRLPRVLDRRPGLLSERHPHLPLVRSAWTMPRSGPRRPTTRRPRKACCG